MTTVILVVLALTAVANEWWRPERAWRAARTTLVVAVVGLLAVLVQRPTLPCPGDGAGAVLLTAGSRPATIRRVLDSVGPAPVFVLQEPGLPTPDWQGARQVPSVAELRRALPGLTALAVTGWGLDEGQLDQLGGVGLSPSLDGYSGTLQWAGWSEPLWLGTRNRIRIGLVPADRPRRLELVDQGGGVVGMGEAPVGASRILVEIEPRVEGRQVFRVAMDSTVVDSIHLAVRPAAPPRVLILGGAPSFELTALRRWLAEEGARVAVRIRVSRGKDRFEFINRDPIGLERLTAPVLDSTDLVVAGGRALDLLTPLEGNLLQSALERGLGLVVLADESDRASAWLRSFGLVPDESRTSGAVRVRFAGASDSRVAVEVGALVLGPKMGQQQILWDRSGRARAAWRPVGAGRVAVSLVETSDRWNRAGEARVFRAYWSLLTSTTARRSRGRWQFEPSGPVLLGAKLTIRREGPGAGKPVLIQAADGATDTLLPVADPEDPAVARAVWWPRAAGWHRLTGGGDTLDLFVVRRADWLPGVARARLNRTKGAWAGQSGRLDVGVPATCRRPMPLLPVVLFLLALLTLLWAEARGLLPERRPGGR